METIAFIGYGEAASAFAGSLPRAFLESARGFDIKSAPKNRQNAAQIENHGVKFCGSVVEAICDADIIFSLVTTDQSEVAASSAEALKPSCLFLDGNSCSPETKRRNEKVISEFGGHYVDLAIMAPVLPDVRKVPLLVSGQYANRAYAKLRSLGFRSQQVEGATGTAASIKMIRSIFVKGLEAVLAECSMAAVKAGVDDQIFASLDKSYPGFDWAERSEYAMERMLEHGTRRAAEMAEVAKTIEDLGVPNEMSRASIAWHKRLGATNIDPRPETYRDLTTRIIDGFTEK